MKERAARWNADTEIQALVQETGHVTFPYSTASRDTLLNRRFDRVALASKGLAYERLDQLTTEVLLGAR